MRGATGGWVTVKLRLHPGVWQRVFVDERGRGEVLISDPHHAEVGDVIRARDLAEGFDMLEPLGPVVERPGKRFRVVEQSQGYRYECFAPEVVGESGGFRL